MNARKPHQLTNSLATPLAFATLVFFCNEMSVFANENFVKPSQMVGQETDKGGGKGESTAQSNHSVLIAQEKVPTAAPAAPSGLTSSTKILRISVHGSMCPSCLLNLKKNLATLNGVTSVEVSAFALSDHQKDWHGSRTVAAYQVQFDPKLITKVQIEERIKQLDFGVSSSRVIN